MLKNMRNPGCIWRVCFEPNAKNVVLILSGHMKVVCAGLVMVKMDGSQVQLGNMLLLPDSKPMKLFANRRKAM
jgi:hypothetical protein